MPVSAQTGSGISQLKDELKKWHRRVVICLTKILLQTNPSVCLPQNDTRKMLRLLDKEIPHGTAVVVERMKTREDRDIIDIDATIYCERDSHKGIIIGKQGSMLKRIGTYARQDMESFLIAR